MQRESPPESNHSVESCYKPINLQKHQRLLNEEEEEEYANQLRQEQLYNVSGLGSKTTITPIEFSGFVAWLLTTVCSILFTVWAFVPEYLFNEHFQLYPHFPDRYYMLALANWFGVFICVYHISLHCVSMIKSHPRDSYFTMVDRHTTLRSPQFCKSQNSNSMNQGYQFGQ